MAVINKQKSFRSVVPPKERMPSHAIEPTEEWTPPPPTLHIEVSVPELESAEVGSSIEFTAKGVLVSKENRKTRRGARISYGLEVHEIAL